MRRAAMMLPYHNHDMYSIAAEDEQLMVNKVNNKEKALKNHDCSVVRREK